MEVPLGPEEAKEREKRKASSRIIGSSPSKCSRSSSFLLTRAFLLAILLLIKLNFCMATHVEPIFPFRRVGEASNPGPSGDVDQGEPNSDFEGKELFSVIGANVTSMRPRWQNIAK